MNYKYLVIIIVVVLLAAGGIYYYWRSQPAPSQAPQIPVTETGEPVKPPPQEDFILLTDVSGGSGEADGFRTKDNDKFIYKLAATLPALSGGNFYEGWLFNPAGDYISAGKLVGKSDRWILTFESDSDYHDYTKAVITLEPNDNDPAPARRILEADFIN